MSRPARGIITRYMRLLDTLGNAPTLVVTFDLDKPVSKDIALAHLELADAGHIVVLPPKHVGNKKRASKKRIEGARVVDGSHWLVKGAPNRVFYIATRVQDPNDIARDVDAILRHARQSIDIASYLGTLP